MNYNCIERFYSRISQTLGDAGFDAFDLCRPKARCSPLVLWPRKVRPNGSLEVGDGRTGRGFPLASLGSHDYKSSLSSDGQPFAPECRSLLLTVGSNPKKWEISFVKRRLVRSSNSFFPCTTSCLASDGGSTKDNR